MNSTTAFSQKNDILQETATRLINALGVESAIYICRSNYWHGVLQLILDQKAGLAAPLQNMQSARTDLSARLHSLPQTTVQTERRYMDVQEVAIAA